MVRPPKLETLRKRIRLPPSYSHLTVIENCHRYDVPVEDYLREVLEILPTLRDPETQATGLTPAKISAARRKDPRPFEAV